MGNEKYIDWGIKSKDITEVTSASLLLRITTTAKDVKEKHPEFDSETEFVIHDILEQIELVKKDPLKYIKIETYGRKFLLGAKTEYRRG